MPDLLVVDADAAIRLSTKHAFDVASSTHDLVAPPLLWVECCNALHRLVRRRRSTDDLELAAYRRIVDAPIRAVDEYDRSAPWDIADMLGWHKTYDAEYLAVARHVSAGIFTFDQQLAEGARRLGVPLVVPG